MDHNLNETTNEPGPAATVAGPELPVPVRVSARRHLLLRAGLLKSTFQPRRKSRVVRLFRDFVDEYRPVGRLEQLIVEEMAMCVLDLTSAETMQSAEVRHRTSESLADFAKQDAESMRIRNCFNDAIKKAEELDQRLDAYTVGDRLEREGDTIRAECCTLLEELRAMRVSTPCRVLDGPLAKAGSYLVFDTVDVDYGEEVEQLASDISNVTTYDLVAHLSWFYAKASKVIGFRMTMWQSEVERDVSHRRCALEALKSSAFDSDAESERLTNTVSARLEQLHAEIAHLQRLREMKQLSHTLAASRIEPTAHQTVMESPVREESLSKSPESGSVSIRSNGKTQDGRMKSSMNAQRHGFYSRKMVLKDRWNGDRQSDYESLLRDLRTSVEPVGHMEHLTVNMLASEYWKLMMNFRTQTMIAEGQCAAVAKGYEAGIYGTDDIIRWYRAWGRDVQKDLRKIQTERCSCEQGGRAGDGDSNSKYGAFIRFRQGLIHSPAVRYRSRSKYENEIIRTDPSDRKRCLEVYEMVFADYKATIEQLLKENLSDKRNVLEQLKTSLEMVLLPSGPEGEKILELRRRLQKRIHKLHRRLVALQTERLEKEARVRDQETVRD